MFIALVPYIHHVVIRAEPAICQHVTKLKLIITANIQHLPKVFILSGFSLALNFFGLHIAILDRLFYQFVGDRNGDVSNMVNEVEKVNAFYRTPKGVVEMPCNQIVLVTVEFLLNSVVRLSSRKWLAYHGSILTWTQRLIFYTVYLAIHGLRRFF